MEEELADRETLNHMPLVEMNEVNVELQDQ